jgi:hypothetical protein
MQSEIEEEISLRRQKLKAVDAHITPTCVNGEVYEIGINV